MERKVLDFDLDDQELHQISQVPTSASQNSPESGFHDSRPVPLSKGIVKAHKRARNEPGVFSRKTKNLPNLALEKIEVAIDQPLRDPSKDISKLKRKLQRKVAQSVIKVSPEEEALSDIEVSQEEKALILSTIEEKKKEIEKEGSSEKKEKKFGNIAIIKALCEVKDLKEFMKKVFKKTKLDVMKDVHNHVPLRERESYAEACQTQIERLNKKFQ
eukprot:TRINITY_DN89826_c0_g1_i1.p1 TRINITY_DN89826_c0_g1~~TRINITY_DN89826_c0_g1_i1.p1  ORF type:complete len:215 (+),score=41.56 TRINITY_DN89826_c0_g1_i1:228-872(+)